MNTPFSSHAWRELQSRAAAQLGSDFADAVLRAAHAGPVQTVSPFRTWLASPFTVSAATAAVCLLAVVFVHARITDATSTQHLADWQEISIQTASLDLNP